MSLNKWTQRQPVNVQPLPVWVFNSILAFTRTATKKKNEKEKVKSQKASEPHPQTNISF